MNVPSSAATKEAMRPAGPSGDPGASRKVGGKADARYTIRARTIALSMRSNPVSCRKMPRRRARWSPS